MIARIPATLPPALPRRHSVSVQLDGHLWHSDGGALWRHGSPSADHLHWRGLAAASTPEGVADVLAGVPGSRRVAAELLGGVVRCEGETIDVHLSYLPLLRLGDAWEVEFAAVPVHPAQAEAADHVRAAMGDAPLIHPVIPYAVRVRAAGEVVAVVCCEVRDGH